MAAGEKVSLDLEQIAALCDALEVEPGTLFERIRTRRASGG
jgi:DNA-binding Xre family transcriptional regulator